MKETPRFCKACGKRLPADIYSYCNARCMMRAHRRADARVTRRPQDNEKLLVEERKPKYGITEHL